MNKEFSFIRRVMPLMAAMFALAMFNVSFGQLPEGIRKEKDIKHVLCHKWNLNYKIGFTTLEEPTESLSTIDLLDNGSLVINTTSPKFGFWSYDKKSHLLILDLKGRTESYKILKLTNKELFLQAIDSGETQIRYWRDD
jgi:hypothetical protein